MVRSKVAGSGDVGLSRTPTLASHWDASVDTPLSQYRKKAVLLGQWNEWVFYSR